MAWKPEGKPRLIGDAEIQYLRSADHGHAGGHQVTLYGRTVVSLPDPHTSTSKRSRAISVALGSLQAAPSHHIDPVAYLVGCLVVIGATNIEIDGVPIVERQAAEVEWQVHLRTDGSVEATWLGR